MTGTSIEARIPALARAATAEASVPPDRIEAETDGLVRAMRSHVAEARKGEVPDAEILAGCETMGRNHARVLRMAYGAAG